MLQGIGSSENANNGRRGRDKIRRNDEYYAHHEEEKVEVNSNLVNNAAKRSRSLTPSALTGTELVRNVK